QRDRGPATATPSVCGDPLPRSATGAQALAKRTRQPGASDLRDDAVDVVGDADALHSVPLRVVELVAGKSVEITRLSDASDFDDRFRSEEHTSELQSRENLVCRLL